MQTKWIRLARRFNPRAGLSTLETSSRTLLSSSASDLTVYVSLPLPHVASRSATRGRSRTSCKQSILSFLSSCSQYAAAAGVASGNDLAVLGMMHSV
ncbi:hypothetical protein BT96DRAFT_928778 [Gymnopus androsaceus JB14]|uniref:Uncharacterized protein n=1 Tax=Gymnopus androsaceus JB14 TaxID=1447944 RepID=A0A6A4GIY3_9AGAR|nr:hypothetical protein BT96DRAFT_928778 [Gymnopus androsaceus JB14]